MESTPHITLYALGYKNLPFTTVWIEFPDIEPRMKALGATPSPKSPTRYTLPVIEDTKTSAVVMDSLAIAAYLDRTYPDTPSLLPQSNSDSAAKDSDATNDAPASPASLAALTTALSALASSPHMHTTPTQRSKNLQKWEKFGSAAWSEENWRALEDAWGVVDGWYAAAGQRDQYLLGPTPTHADFALAAQLKSFQLLLTPQEWARVCAWHGGRWAALLGAVEEWWVV
ncbi:hypothetical protein BV22DRAFT_1132124 [Leucogyrophana mollusca]|uniref:Uncharacterized protein n=1 Tax=Leucogyrophana mollusca TaxID=85980 RepID=A0ACB8B8T3_9AGAM|nr:hypothetical protein BV22DRAFT_1132124 [Leucogyrophana mollusca]